jgi:5-methylcytosine-specific restriction endonuclease McrA
MKYKVPRKGKLLSVVAHHLGLGGNEGLSKIAAAVCVKIRRWPATTKAERWQVINDFALTIPEAPKATPAERKVSRDVNSDGFLRSYEWRKLRLQAIEKHGRRCQCCGATPDDGVTKIHVDHIKPRRKYPHLALKLENLQVLCELCNHGKGNWNETDWRPDEDNTIQDHEPCWAPHVVRWKPKRY